jgi:hypothetical protein
MTLEGGLTTCCRELLIIFLLEIHDPILHTHGSSVYKLQPLTYHIKKVVTGTITTCMRRDSTTNPT